MCASVSQPVSGFVQADLVASGGKGSARARAAAAAAAAAAIAGSS